MIAQLKYGSGVPFNRLEQLEGLLGIPLPAATQWEVVEEAAELITPACDELIRQAAQGEVRHNDDTSMRVLKLARESSDERTGVFTTGIVSKASGREIALCFTGRQHAGENLADVLAQRAVGSGPVIQMSDALSRNTPKLHPGGGNPAGEVSGARKAAVRGYRAELPGRVPVRSRIARRGLLQRCGGV
jgi:transposase